MKDRPLQTRIIYGPIDSRRLGKSLGVNILPTAEKICSFDCLYCQYGFTAEKQDRAGARRVELPFPAEVAEELAAALALSGPLDAITLAGNGEPTLHPAFRQIAEAVAHQRDLHRPGVPVCILSNSSTLHDPNVQAAFQSIDRRVMKLDAGTEETFQKLNRPGPGLTLEKIAGGLAQLKPVEIQALFLDGPVSNTASKEIEAWLGHLEKIRPVAVQVYTFDRQPADQRLVQVSGERLEQIAAAVRSRLPKAKVTVY
ncbi:MAG: hypothetical protein A3F83_14365 [Candidatus Glassbacteria bacterium RIFCSPLOWO2_12_FULL_58_11]|uniref:Radical SAM core domain-containing protein n=2 Tax=Candidatus Glassiibacteriota TaxID=1817805 RepID=A0A1F5YUR4_9BACT|nr:MAG: hypothetical protein A2Z86_00880 [Candidatus Glassbacteria bacterium GWA2_58_10]OGG03632.1 MAG: hypothetical protein A3F83_14365 [Candidatus Glassbacteria bacterium RIFCSPLOWO2_12_FULL_58_11]